MEIKELIEHNASVLEEFLGEKAPKFTWVYPFEAKYHEEWDWLMLIVETIEDIKNGKQLLFQVVINGFDCYIEAHALVHNFKSDFRHCERTKIEAVYYTCVAFIKWYNKQDKQPWKEKK